MDYRGLLIIAIGVYALLASVFEWKWFFNSRKAKRMVKLISYKGARGLYGVLGIILIGAGLMILIGSPV